MATELPTLRTLNALGSNWQAGVVPAASTAAVPEPTGIILLLTGLLGLVSAKVLYK
jgi:hypothetical protein